MNADFEPLPCPDNFVDWLNHRSESASLKEAAFAAIEVYRAWSNATISHETPLDPLYFAACHARVVVWEVGLSLLAKLAETNSQAREKIRELSHESKAELRLRSIRYMNDRYPRSFCVSILSQLLVDRSAKVKDVVAGKISSLNLVELLPSIEQALTQESDETILWSYAHVLSLMRYGYHYDTRDDDSTLWLYYPELYPAGSIYVQDAQLSFERGENIEIIKRETLRQHPDIVLCSCDWEWDTTGTSEYDGEWPCCKP